jgi:hypothetical protein
MMRFRNLLPLVALAGVALLGAPTRAHAIFQVRVTTLSGTQTITDGGVGDLDGLVNNSITVNYADASYHLVGTISFTNAPGTATKAILDVSYNVNTNGGELGGAASLEASATGFTQPNSNPETMTFALNGNGSGTGTLSGQSWVVQNGAVFAESGPFTVSEPPSGPPFNVNGAYGGTGSVSYNGATPYTLTEKLSFSLSPNSNTSGDGQITITTPAPAGVVLALTGLPCCGIGAWIRRRRNATK